MIDWIKAAAMIRRPEIWKGDRMEDEKEEEEEEEEEKMTVNN